MAVIGFLLAWPLYGELYRHGDDTPLPWNNMTRNVIGPRFAEAQTRVFESGLEASRHLRAHGAQSVTLELTSWTYVLVAAGPRSSSGYSLQIERVTEERGRVVVRVRERTPTPDNDVEPRVTYPFLLLALPAGDKPIRVELEGRP